MSKGAETRSRILDHAYKVATRDGLEGLSIGTLASDLNLSKSGLFAHFGSKEDLQIEVLKLAAERFDNEVIRVALKAPRGEPRVRKLFDLWVRWQGDLGSPGGCLFIAAATELDDREGKPRDYLVATERQLLGALSKAARIAIEEGHFRRDLDCEQFAFELYGVLLSSNHIRRLLRDPKADARTRASFERLILDAAARS